MRTSEACSSNVCRLSDTTSHKPADGVSGLERLRVDDPDLLMVDYAMPGMNGLQVIEKAREIAREFASDSGHRLRRHRRLEDH